MWQNKSTANLHTNDKEQTIFLDTSVLYVPLGNGNFFPKLIAQKLMKNLSE